MANSAGRIARSTANTARSKVGKGGKVPGVSPNPMTNLVVADLVLRGSGRLMRRTVERMLLKTKYDSGMATRIIKGRGLTKTLLSTAIARVATSSVPGAIVVGGGLLAKTIYDRSQGRKAAREGEKDVAEQAKAGAEKE